MAKPNWLNENQYRDYPFVSRDRPLDGGVFDLPRNAITDCGFVLGPISGFDPEQHSIWLSSITRTGGFLFFNFQCDAPGAEDEPLSFPVIESAAEHTTHHSELIFSETQEPGIEPSSLSITCPETVIWSGFLTVGRLSDLLDLIASDETVSMAAEDWVVQAARVQNLNETVLTDLSIANRDRSRYADDEECLDSSAALSSSEDYFVDAACRTGAFLFQEGYNVFVRVDEQENSITFGAGVGAGAGEPCEEIPLFEGEEAPAGSQYLGGGPACDELVRAVNGMFGPHLLVTAGPGFNVSVDPVNPHRLLVTADFRGFAATACLPEYLEPLPEESSLSSAASSEGL